MRIRYNAWHAIALHQLPENVDEWKSLVANQLADADDDAVMMAAHLRKKHHRRPLPDHLPRIAVIHGFPESERLCDADGRILTDVGETVSKQLEIVLANWANRSALQLSRLFNPQ